MSIIQSIRDKGAWVLGSVIALALIAFILQDGAKQASGIGKSSNIGKVNGVAIDGVEFNEKVEAATKNNGAQRDQVMNQMFEQEVSKILLEEEFDKVGVACSDKELNEEMFKPSSQFAQQFRDPKTQQIDVERAKQWYIDFKKKPVEQAKQFVYESINQTKLVTKYNKYTALMNQAAYAPKWLLEKQQADNNAFASLSYVAVPYTSISDSTVKVSDDEILAYGRKHHKMYDRDEETRSISYAIFEALPNGNDSNRAKAKIEEKATAFKAETNMKNFFARNNTDIPYKNTFVAASKISSVMKDSIIKLPVGSSYGPYVEGTNYVIAKLVATRSIPDSVRARHILIKTAERGQGGEMMPMGNDSLAKHTLDTAVMKIKAGASFDSICKVYSQDGSAQDGGDLKFFATGQMVDEFNNFCFTNPVGSKDIVKTMFGYHYIEITAAKGSITGYDVAFYTSPISLSTETDLAVSNEAKKFAAKVNNKKEFDLEVASLKKQPIVADNIKKSDFNVGMLQNCKSLVRWVYDNKVGEVSKDPQHINNKYIVSVVSEINAKGLPGVASLKGQVESVVKNEKKAKEIIAKMKGANLDEIAKNVGYNSTVTRLDTFLVANPFAPVVNQDNKFTGAALNVTNKGKISEPIAGTSSVFVVKVDNVATKPSTMPQDPMMMKGSMTQTIKGLCSKIVNELLKKSATIVDNRADF